MELPESSLPDEISRHFVEVRRWFINDNAAVEDVQISHKTLNSFITNKIFKFRQNLDVQEHRGGNGRQKKNNSGKTLLGRLMRSNPFRCHAVTQANDERKFTEIHIKCCQ